MRRASVVLMLGMATCAPKRLADPGPAPAQLGWADKVDWPAARAEAIDLLSRYLQVDTINPPGHELAGAQFLAAKLQEDGPKQYSTIQICPLSVERH